MIFLLLLQQLAVFFLHARSHSTNEEARVKNIQIPPMFPVHLSVSQPIPKGYHRNIDDVADNVGPQVIEYICICRNKVLAGNVSFKRRPGYFPHHRIFLTVHADRLVF
ncbi:hypothetical protein ACO0LM_22445 [Undibacterium sp. Di26W]|uniref:hypothetical protein n=1 Tax=Undibacterium sp. Di26W TaxID=3413035 RepID=UPI003BEF93EE